MKRWIHAATQSVITVEELMQNDGSMKVDGYTIEIGRLYNKKTNDYSGGLGKKTVVSNFDKGVERVFNSPEKAVEFLNNQLKTSVKSATEIPEGYLKTTKFTTSSIKTNDQRNALEALEVAIAQKFDQFDKMCEITAHLTSDTFWQGTIDEYPEGYYIRLEGTRSNFQAFVQGDEVIRKPRQLSEKLGTYSVEGTSGTVNYMSRRKS